MFIYTVSYVQLNISIVNQGTWVKLPLFPHSLPCLMNHGTWREILENFSLGHNWKSLWETPFIQTCELQEDHGANSHYVGSRICLSTLSFRPPNDVFTRHFMMIWPQNQDIHRLIWVCRALTPINLEYIELERQVSLSDTRVKLLIISIT